MRRRGWGTIIREILEVTLTPQKKMRIMYKTNLSYASFNNYFSFCLKKGFIEKTRDSEGNVCYSISQRGRTLLAVLNKAQELVSTEEL